jgi:hypothetical protein
MRGSAQASYLEAKPLTVVFVLSCISIVVIANPILLGFLFGASLLRLSAFIVFDIVLIVFGVYLPLFAANTGRTWLLIVSILVIVGMPVVAVAAEVFVGYSNAEKAKSRFQSIAAKRDPLFRAHPQFGWWHPPNAQIIESTSGYTAVYRTDDKGRKIVDQPPAATKMHFFGGSFIFAYGVSNTDSALQKLADSFAVSSQINFLNYGVAGHGPEQMLARFRSSVPEMHKGDIVVFTLVSDVVKRSVIEGSYLCDYALHFGVGVQYLPVFHNDKLEFHKIWEVCNYVLSLFRFSRQPLGSTFKHIYERYQEFQNGERLKQNTIDIVENAKNFALERGLEFILVIFPNYDECLTHTSKLDSWQFGVEPISLSQLCPDSPGEVSRLYYVDAPWTGHWTVEGNKWAAKSMEILFARRGLLK